MVIPKIAEKNVGTYTVKATNEFGSEERLCKLDILDLPKILNKLDNLTVNETQSAQFTVKFSGKPTPKVEWFKDDTKIEMTENIEIDESVENSVTIVIKSSSSVEHACSYFAKVSNEFGDVASNKAMLTINSEYFTFNFYNFLLVFHKIVLLKGLPIFLTKPSDTTAVLDQALKLESSISAIPKAKVQWFLNDKELTAKDNVKLEADAQTSANNLIIPKILSTHNGTMRIVATNSVGVAEHSFTLVINGNI